MLNYKGDPRDLIYVKPQERRTEASSSQDVRDQWTIDDYSGTIGALEEVEAIRKTDFDGIIKSKNETQYIKDKMQEFKDLIPSRSSKGFKINSSNPEAFIKEWDITAQTSKDRGVKQAMRDVLSRATIAIKSGTR